MFSGCNAPGFLPPYRSELNRIEKYGHKMKYELMEFKRRTSETLETDMDKVLSGFSNGYKFSFY
jgi:transposase